MNFLAQLLAMTGRVGRLLFLLVCVIATVAFATLFYQDNSAPIAVRLMHLSTSEQPVWLWLLVAMGIGFLLGLLVMASVNLRLVWRVRVAGRAARTAETVGPRPSDLQALETSKAV